MRHGQLNISSSGKIYDSRIIKRLYKYVQKDIYLIVGGIIVSLIMTILQLYMPLIFKSAVDNYIVKTVRIINIKNLKELHIKGIPIDDSLLAVKERVLKKNPHLRPLDKKIYIYFIKKYRKDIKFKPSYISKDYIFFEYSLLNRIPKALLISLRASDINGLIKTAIVFLIVIIISFFASFAQVFLLTYAGQKILHRLRVDVYNHVLKLPVKFFDTQKRGRLVTRVTNDVQTISQLFSEVLPSVTGDVLILLGIMVFLPIINLRLSMILYAILPVLFLSIYYFRILLRKAYRKVRTLLSNLNSFISENISGIQTIQILQREEKQKKDFNEINHAYFKANYKQFLIFAVFRPFINFLSSLALALVIYFGGISVITGLATLGTLIAFTAYIERFFNPIRDISEKFNILQSAMAAGEKVFEIMDTKIEENSGNIKTHTFKGKIEFKHVWFAYEKNNYVLKDVSFTIEPGEKIAIVGPTGAGKTSIINLMFNFYDVNKGEILIDGQNIKEYDKTYLRKNIGAVLQDIVLFADTLEENITLGETFSKKEIEKALEIVHMKDFVKKRFNDNTEIQEEGSNLSQGEKQLLNFARALLFKPAIFIMDEATANVDSKTEDIIHNELKSLLKETTTIIIAHRLSTIKIVDRILVISNGSVIENGTHEQLMQKKGIYYNLYRLQMAK